MYDQIYNDDMLIDTFSTVFDMKVTVQDMKQLKPDFVQKIYLHFIRDLGADLEQINQVCHRLWRDREMLNVNFFPVVFKSWLLYCFQLAVLA